jgi:5'-3' exonuclease
MVAPDGHPNNAVRGTLSMLSGLVRRFNTRNVVPAWDNSWRPDWRVELVPSYKTHRLAHDGEEEEPDTLSPQISAIFHLLTAMGMPPIGIDGYEADDVIASFATQSDPPSIIVTNDRDLLQCVDDSHGTSVFLMTPGGMDNWHILKEADVAAKYGVRPNQYVDFAVLRGDPSDGLPGVPGVGVKTAQALLSAFGDLDGVLSACGSDAIQRPLTPRIKSNINPSALQAAKLVTTARKDLPLATQRPWSPDRMSDATRDELADEWGVQRQVTDLVKALEAANNTTS